MDVNFNHFESFSTVDYPGRVSCIVFLNGCNFRCRNCHNKQTWTGRNYINIAIIKKKILESKPVINTVVFSGGEPTMQVKPLLELCKFSKENGFTVGIETNGSFTKNVLKIKPYVDLFMISINTKTINPNTYKTIKLDIPLQIRIVNFDQSKTDKIVRSLPDNMNIKILDVNKKLKKLK